MFTHGFFRDHWYHNQPVPKKFDSGCILYWTLSGRWPGATGVGPLIHQHSRFFVKVPLEGPFLARRPALLRISQHHWGAVAKVLVHLLHRQTVAFPRHLPRGRVRLDPLEVGKSWESPKWRSEDRGLRGILQVIHILHWLLTSANIPNLGVANQHSTVFDDTENPNNPQVHDPFWSLGSIRLWGVHK